MADAGKDDGVREGELFGRTGALRSCAEAMEGALDGGDVAGAVIEDEKIHELALRAP